MSEIEIKSVQTSDEKILARLNKNDEKALSILYERYWEKLFISAYNLVKKREVCEDIIQEIFINIWNKRGEIKIHTSLKSYLYTCVTYKVYDYFRKNNKVIEVQLFENIEKRIQDSTPESKLIFKELVAHINLHIDLLPEKSRIVFKLSRIEQLSHKEIAKKLNISTKTVEAHITNAIKILRTSLSTYASIELLLLIFRDIIN